MVEDIEFQLLHFTTRGRAVVRNPSPFTWSTLAGFDHVPVDEEHLSPQATPFLTVYILPVIYFSSPLYMFY